MSKQGEKDYLKNISDDGRKHSYNKPFSDPRCGCYLQDIGALLSLLPPPPAKLLDLGIGGGWTSIFFAKRGYQVTGQDISEEMISLANSNKKRYDVEQTEFTTSDYEELTFNNVFDCAVFYDSLHHSLDEEKAIASVYRALKPNGVCLTVEPGMWHSKQEGSKKVIDLYNVTEKDMHPRKIIQLGKRAGFKKFKVYFRPSEPPEVASFISFKGAISLCRKILRFLPVLCVLRSNIVVMTK